MVIIPSRQLTHCPAYNPIASYPSLCPASRKTVRRNRYRKTDDPNQPHFCGGGSYSRKFYIVIAQNRTHSRSESPTSLQDKDTPSSALQEKVSLCVSPWGETQSLTFCCKPVSVGYRRSLESLSCNIFTQLKQLISHHTDRKGKQYENTLFNEWHYFSLSKEGSQRIETTAPVTSLESYFQKVSAGEDLSVSEKMVFEALRLQSFYEVNTEISALTLAKCGFFATGNGNETKCYSCEITYRHWRRTDNCLLTHTRISPNCRHVKGTDSRNVPISGTSAPTVQPAAEPADDTTTTPATCYKVSNSFHAESSTSSQIDDAISTDSGIGSVPVDDASTALNTSYKMSNSLNADSRSSRTPHTGDATGSDSGIGSVQEKASYDQPVTTATEQSASAVTASDEAFVLEFREAVYPQYKETKKRLESYLTWPKNHCKKPAELVCVGFFYAGYSDCVRCFVCGIGLRTWETEDDPWVEHVRWRSSCDFVTQVRGQSFVINTLAVLGRQLTVKQTGRLLETDACRHALQMGFSEEIVTKAAEQISSLQGADKLQLHILLEQVLILQEDNTKSTEIPVTNTYEETESKPATLPDPKTESNLPKPSGTKIFKRKTTNKPADTASLESAQEENRQMRESSQCKICLEETANIVFLPCGHLVACVTCSPALERCPVCRQHIRGTVRVHLATMKSMKGTN